MNSQPNTKPKEKEGAKSNEDNNEQEPAGEGENQTPPPGAAHSSAQSHTIIPKNLIDLLNNTGNDALTVVNNARPQQESPANNVHHKVVKPQAATTHQLNADESPGKIVKLQAETIPASQKAPSAHQVGISPKKRLRNADPSYVGKKREETPRKWNLVHLLQAKNTFVIFHKLRKYKQTTFFRKAISLI